MWLQLQPRRYLLRITRRKNNPRFFFHGKSDERGSGYDKVWVSLWYSFVASFHIRAGRVIPEGFCSRVGLSGVIPMPGYEKTPVIACGLGPQLQE